LSASGRGHPALALCLAAGAVMASACDDPAESGPQGPLDLFSETWWPVPDESGITELLEHSALFEEHPELITGMSSWFEVTGYAEPGEEAADSSLLGYYGLGNGVSFGFVGTSHPRNTLHGMLGPDYQRFDRGYFSDFRAKLEQDGARLRWTRDHIWKLRQANVVLTRMEVQGAPVELCTVTFAPASDLPGEERRTIVQLLDVRNRGGEPVKGLTLRVQSYSDADTLDADAVLLEQVRDHHRLRVRPADTDAWILAEQAEQRFPALVTPSFALDPGAERRWLMVYEFSLADAAPGAGREAVLTAGFDALLEQTVAWWRDWHRAGLQVRTPDARVNDLVEGLKSTIRVQTSASGAVSPMSHHTHTWLRDCYAPVRIWLKLGYPDEAWGIMDYLFKGSAVRGGITNALESNLAIPDPLPAHDWYGDMPFSGRERGEGPSHLPLMYAYYWRYTGEGQDLADRWDFLMHALRGQPVADAPGAEGLLHFSGDETFRPQLSANIGLPGGASYKFEELCYSANSSFLYVRACEMLSGYAGEYGLDRAEDIAWLDRQATDIRAAAEQHYWLDEEGRYSPFVYIDTLIADPHAAEDVNTQPIWLHYLDADSEQARENMRSTIELIGQGNGILQNIPEEPGQMLGFEVGGGLMTGMAPAYFLYNSSELELESAEQTFDTVAAYLSPSGNAHEVGLFAQPEAAFCPIYFDNSVMGELYGRFREWEGAIVAEAIVNHLIGYEADVIEGFIRLTPRLLHGSDWLEAANLMFDRHPLHLRVDRERGGYRYAITCEDEPAGFGLDEVHLRLLVELRRVEQVTVNGQDRTSDTFTVSEPYRGALQVRMAVPAQQGETEIRVLGQASGG